MLRAFLLVPLLLAGCREAPAPQFPVSACETSSFEGSRFTACRVKNGRIELQTFDPAGQPLRSFSKLEQALGAHSRNVAFAMNAGMFDEQGRPIGLLVENGKQVHAINLRKGGGNFHLLPNGVFLLRRNGRAEIVQSARYKGDGVRYATQSGPMLVIDGKLHPKFDPDGASQNIRNGVGIAPDGTPMFVISEDPVSFGKFARFFRDQVKAKNALYFDGAVSSLWDPASARMDTHSPLGPMVVVFKPAASKPGRASPATP